MYPAWCSVYLLLLHNTKSSTGHCGRAFMGKCSFRWSGVASLSLNIVTIFYIYTYEPFSTTVPLISCILTTRIIQSKLLVKNLHVQLQVYIKSIINVAWNPLAFSSRKFCIGPNPDLPRHAGIPLALHWTHPMTQNKSVWKWFRGQKGSSEDFEPFNNFPILESPCLYFTSRKFD